MKVKKINFFVVEIDTNNNIDYIYNHKKWVQENQEVLEQVVNSEPPEDFKGIYLIYFRWANKDFNKRLLGSRFKNPFMGSCMAKGLVVEKIGV